MERLLTVRELADYLNVNPMTVYRLVQGGQILAFKVSSGWRFRKEAIRRWIEKQEENNGNGGAKKRGSKWAD